MGNTPRGMLLPGNEDCSYKVKYGKSVIKVSERKMGTNDDGESYEQRTVLYKIHDRTSTFCLTKSRRVGNDLDHKFVITLQDQVQNWSYSFQMEVQTTEGDGDETELMLSSALVTMGSHCRKCDGVEKMDLTRNTKTTVTAGGESTVTSFNQYEIPKSSVNEKGLVVLELKKKGLDKSPYMLTVAHYFVSFSKTDTGFSMIVKINGGGNRGLGVQVEGPVKHPAASLFHMFHQVQRTGCWTPFACSHCADDDNQTQRQNMSQGVSEDEDSVTVGTAGTSQCEPLSSSVHQTNTSFISNSGLTVGNDNGSITLSIGTTTIVINRGGD